ncbi:MAG: RnfABCDGE type electron transport complex subunit D [Clostridia bacterium]|nr:RnfABCDGE type electron transport complex subunit D [Clostridia bacterium]
MAERYSGAGPHIRCEDSTRSMMLDVLIALAPAFLWGFYAFGLRAAAILAISLLSCVGIEAILLFIPGRGGSVSDLSALVTGAVLAAALPVATPLYLVPLGAFFAMGLKALFGGLGKNPVNPALFSLALLYFTFPEKLSRFTRPFDGLPSFSFTAEELAAAREPSPLQALLKGDLTQSITVSQLLTGSVAGGIASSSVLLLLAGLLYLLVRRVVSLHVPVSILIGAFGTALLLAKGSWSERAMLALLTLLSGSLIFLAVFGATDPVTSPITRKSKLLYGLLIGGLTVLLRSRTGALEGGVVAVLLVSLFSRPMDFLGRPRVYGKKRGLIRSLAALPAVWKHRFLRLKEKLERFKTKKQDPTP